MADPFDVTNSDTPYQPSNSAGISPDVWRNLMAFGMSTMAAGAKPGATTLGALGQGGMAAMENSRQNAQMRMQQQLYGSEAGKNNLANQLQLMNMNAYRHHYMPGSPDIQLGPNGQIIQQPYQSIQPQQMDQSQNIPASSPGSQTASAGNTPQESSGMTGPMWVGTAGNTRTSNQPQMNMYLVDPYSAPRGVSQQAFDQANMLNMVGNPLGKNVADLAFAGPTEAAVTPYKIQQERSNFRDVRGAAGLPAFVFDPLANGGRGGIAAEGAQLGIIPQGQIGAGTPYRLPPTVSGGINTSYQNQQSQPDLTLAMPTQAEIESSAAPYTGVGNPANNQNVPSPTQQQLAGLPIGAVQTGLSPQAHELLTVGAHDMLEKQRPAYEAAQQTLNGATVIDANIDKLGPEGWFSPGAGGGERIAISKGWNGALTALGMTPESNPDLFANVEKIATGEELNKQTVNLGFNLARTMGARESQQVVEQAIKINPGLGTTYLGGHMVNSLIAENAQRSKDQYEYKMNALNNGIDPLTAETQFNKIYSGPSYVKRAMSQFAPINVNTPGALKNLLPGTVIKFGNGNPKVIPMLQDYPFTMPPTNHQLGNQ